MDAYLRKLEREEDPGLAYERMRRGRCPTCGGGLFESGDCPSCRIRVRQHPESGGFSYGSTPLVLTIFPQGVTQGVRPRREALYDTVLLEDERLPTN